MTVESASDAWGPAETGVEPTLFDLLEDNPDGFVVLSPVGTVLFVNRTAASMFGQAPNELVGGSLEIEINSASSEGTAELRIRQVNWRGAPAALIQLRDVTWDKDDAVAAFRATHDAVTRLPNRYLLGDRLTQTLTRAERSERGAFLFYCLPQGADGQSWLEDAWHRDQLLLQAAQRLTRVVRPSDTTAYLGNGEFAVLCDQLDGTEARRVEDRLRASFGDAFAFDDRRFSAVLKVGSIPVEDSLLDAEMLLEWAKKAMDQGDDV